MADSEASAEARLDDPVDDPVDTDPLAVQRPDDAEAPTADRQFGYLFDDPDEAANEPGDHDQPAAAQWVPPPPLDPAVHPFNAFDEGTWNFKPAPAPWYRTGRSPVVLAAASVAVVALVVSVVLLAFRGVDRDDKAPAAIETSAAPTTVTAPVSTSGLPPAPPPPPPPPPTSQSASEVQRQAPVIERQQPTRKPEFNVTRAPMSVHPNMPGNPRRP